jgi:hypothetical protein
MLPIFEAMLAGGSVGIINRHLARMEHECPEHVRKEMGRNDSTASAASSGTVEIPHFH